MYFQVQGLTKNPSPKGACLNWKTPKASSLQCKSNGTIQGQSPIKSPKRQGKSKATVQMQVPTTNPRPHYESTTPKETL